MTAEICRELGSVMGWTVLETLEMYNAMTNEIRKPASQHATYIVS